MKTMIGAVAVLALTILLLGLLYINFANLPWDSFGGDPEALLPRSQVLSYLIGPLSAVIAFVALMVSIASTTATLQQGVRSENAARFQKAVDLMAEGKNSTIAAGAGLLGNLA